MNNSRLNLLYHILYTDYKSQMSNEIFSYFNYDSYKDSLRYSRNLILNITEFTEYHLELMQ